MRSEPDAWSARVMTARAAGLFHSRGDVRANRSRPRPGRRRPPARGAHMHDHRRPADVGERLARQPRRGHAGGNQDQDAVGHAVRPRPVCGPRAYTGCQRRGKPAICAPPSIPASRSRSAMNSFEINKVLGALLGTCLVLLAVNIAAGAIFCAEAPAKPGYEIAVKEEAPEESQGEAPAKEVPIENAAGERLGRARRQCRQAMPGLPHLREGRAQQGRARSLRHRRPAASPPRRASTTRPP